MTTTLRPQTASVRPTRVDIDLDALRANAAAIAARCGVPVCAVVKADAYGHGAVPSARALEHATGVCGLAVALVEEGIELRDAGIDGPILLMGAALGDAHAEVVAYRLTPMISRPEDLRRFAEIGAGRGAPVDVHLKIDTGMTRLGVDEAQVPALVSEAIAAGGVRIDGLCTHLACADEDDPAGPDTPTARQLARFRAAVDAARAAGARPRQLHVANSAAALGFAGAGFDFVRPGLALYGNGPRPPEVTLGQVMRFCSAVIQLRDVSAGTSVSYGAVWTAERPSRIAVVPAGYADGYPRRLTGSAEVLVRGRRCPVVGKVCMDMILIDVTALGDDIAVGDEVVLLGPQGGDAISAREFASRAGITEYEVTCGISKRVPRVYHGAA